ncbi:MAG TPA: TolC family protein [Thermoanaerobaculia bacterium]|nr:TolC family protein [Thermoanaerobaculia bacterium]
MIEPKPSPPRRGGVAALSALSAIAALLAVGFVPGPAAAQEIRLRTSAPETVVAPELSVQEGAIQLSLEQAIELALRRNLLLIVERYSRAQAEQGILQNMGIYDLFTDAELSTSDFQQATASQLQASDFEEQQLNLGLSQLLPSGGNLTFDWDNSRQETNLIFSNLNPAFNSSAGFGLTQPLLRNFGRLATERGIMVARKNSAISAEAFELQVTTTLLDVETAYWDLVETREQLTVAEEGLGLARELHDQNRVRVDVGTLAPLELVQSEVGIATREEEIIRAQSAIGNAEDRLKRLLNVEERELWGLPIVPLTAPETERVPLDLEQAIATALAERPEIATQRLILERSEIDSAYFRNQKRPRLDLSARYGYGGVGGDLLLRDPETGEVVGTVPGGFDDALDQISGGDFPGWTLGLFWAFPLQNRTARAQSAIADIEVDKAQAVLDDIDQFISTGVRTAVRAVETAAKAIDSARVSRQLAEKNLDAERKRYENGMSTSFQILEIQEDLTAARSREVSAVTEYRRALVEYHRAIGRLLEEHGVALEDPAAAQ